MRDFFRRLKALTIKEFHQLLRDKSNLMLGIGLPIILIFIFGYGISFDISNARVGVVDQIHSESSLKIITAINASTYLEVETYPSVPAAQGAMDAQAIEGYLVIPNNFDNELQQQRAQLQFLADGKDSNRAQTLYTYVLSAVTSSFTKNLVVKNGERGTGVTVDFRMWFNQASSSTWSIVPGLIVLIVTIVGTFLTALVMAREWERGTLEAIFVSPVRPIEIILGKIIPFFVVGLAGLILCMVAAWLLFKVPLQGSIIVLYIISMLYLLISLAIGLLISARTRNQFLSCQLSVIVSFMPCIMLSGFIFDLRNVPAIVDFLGHLLPSTYYMEIIKTLYLAGDYWPLIIKDGLILTGYAVFLIGLTVRITKKSLD